MRDRGVGATSRAVGGREHGPVAAEQFESQIRPVGRGAPRGGRERRNRRERVGGEGHSVDIDRVHRCRPDVEGVERGFHVGLRIPKHHHERARRLGTGGERANIEGEVDRDVVHGAGGVGGREQHVERIAHGVAAEHLAFRRYDGARVVRAEAERRVRDRRHDESAAAGDVVGRVPLRPRIGILGFEQGHAGERRRGEVSDGRRDRHVVVAVATPHEPLEDDARLWLAGDPHEVGRAGTVPREAHRKRRRAEIEEPRVVVVRAADRERERGKPMKLDAVPQLAERRAAEVAHGVEAQRERRAGDLERSGHAFPRHADMGEHHVPGLDRFGGRRGVIRLDTEQPADEHDERVVRHAPTGHLDAICAGGGYDRAFDGGLPERRRRSRRHSRAAGAHEREREWRVRGGGGRDRDTTSRFDRERVGVHVGRARNPAGHARTHRVRDRSHGGGERLGGGRRVVGGTTERLSFEGRVDPDVHGVRARRGSGVAHDDRPRPRGRRGHRTDDRHRSGCRRRGDRLVAARIAKRHGRRHARRRRHGHGERLPRVDGDREGILVGGAGEEAGGAPAVDEAAEGCDRLEWCRDGCTEEVEAQCGCVGERRIADGVGQCPRRQRKREHGLLRDAGEPKPHHARRDERRGGDRSQRHDQVVRAHRRGRHVVVKRHVDRGERQRHDGRRRRRRADDGERRGVVAERSAEGTEECPVGVPREHARRERHHLQPADRDGARGKVKPYGRGIHDRRGRGRHAIDGQVTGGERGRGDGVGERDRERRRGGGDHAVHGGVRAHHAEAEGADERVGVEPAAGDGLAGKRGNRVGGREQQALELGRGECRGHGEGEGRRTGHVRRRHARAGKRGVSVARRRAHDVDARRAQVHGREAVVAERGEGVAAVGGGHAHDVLRRVTPRIRRRGIVVSAIVARGRHEEDIGSSAGIDRVEEPLHVATATPRVVRHAHVHAVGRAHHRGVVHGPDRIRR